MYLSKGFLKYFLLCFSLSFSLSLSLSLFRSFFRLFRVPSVQQCAHQHAGPAVKPHGSCGEVDPAGPHLPPTHHQLPHLLQLEQERQVLRGDLRQKQQPEAGECTHTHTHTHTHIHTQAVF